METQALGKNPPQDGDAESTMRRNLGLDGTSPPFSANDPLKMARQAIRSQVTAREYTERQLDQAQGTIQDLRGKLRHVHHEREAAVNAAQSAMVARDTAERKMRAAEAALVAERATRTRIEEMLRDAEATIRDLREKLATANQKLHSMQAELATERAARSSAEDRVVVMPEAMVPTIPKGGLPVIRRPVGRPRKILAAQPVQTMTTPSEKPQVIVSPIVDGAGQIVKRPVGRPRKVVVEPSETLITQPKNPSVSGKSVTAIPARAKQRDQRRRTDDQEPVQWWVEGWKNR
jgi:hypothetical protein